MLADVHGMLVKLMESMSTLTNKVDNLDIGLTNVESTMATKKDLQNIEDRLNKKIDDKINELKEDIPHIVKSEVSKVLPDILSDILPDAVKNEIEKYHAEVKLVKKEE